MSKKKPRIKPKSRRWYLLMALSLIILAVGINKIVETYQQHQLEKRFTNISIHMEELKEDIDKIYPDIETKTGKTCIKNEVKYGGGDIYCITGVNIFIQKARSKDSIIDELHNILTENNFYPQQKNESSEYKGINYYNYTYDLDNFPCYLRTTLNEKKETNTIEIECLTKSSRKFIP